MSASLGTLDLVPAAERPDLLAPPVAGALAGLSADDAATVLVCEIDPDLADTAALTDAYDLPLEVSANCIVVLGKRAGEERTAGCVIPADARLDVNGVVRKRLDVRKCSFAPREWATEHTAMEYGGITPVGLPGAWPLLIDERVAQLDQAIIGSGLRRSKLVLPGRVLAALPGAQVLPLATA
ncbi:prolyl-tRNA editing enzyme YbaK/EbsC (Cys-tRNA(Pro) deacylase) [Mumia flava]|uniref:Prolyl-tRNA editing enzyme YbaK/EbsC (Cys-tRNA(Pro) deacylase) n=1 Tax=Mumia flava TaxID=1348852 RepID=A0A0B2B1H9_9ACTN|nr:YbaK/EbsC family protein [Mumia flava]PJJ58444.1 prolyl-tRNA editing enzyme YbaK/EbsC (Cys-tRNA(Pro) deacylase) [Mumia flava]